MSAALAELLTVVQAAIRSGDWKVDGACDPDIAIYMAEQELERAGYRLDSIIGEEWIHE